MLTFLISLVIMFTVVYACVNWAKREERRRRPQGGGPMPAIIDSAPELHHHVNGRQAGRRLGRLHPPGGLREVRRGS